MALCDFQPTTKRTPQGRLIWKCASCPNACCGDRPANAICRAYPRDVKVKRKPLDTTCQHRGSSLGTINCGCGSANRETEVFACPLKGACTLSALGGKAGWLKLGIKERPIYCATCEERKP